MAIVKTVFSVSELNLASQKLLEAQFPSIWVEGEISNLVKPSSGHIYFSLKDAKAQIRCAFFRHKALRLSFEPRNGQLVQVLCTVSLYPDRGDYQLIVESLEEAGDGLLKKAYDQLIQKLSLEGLFLERWKKQIPKYPRRIGVITSPTGAAIKDILSVLKRRFPLIPILIYPTKVQGLEAADEIIRAIQAANEQASVDVLILARGGGSLEDLWPFNEERVARAIFASLLPIVTGIGHEIDFTISDWVGDHRAPTPSAAAELVAPDSALLLKQLITFETRLIQAIQKQLYYHAQQVDWLSKRLRHPGFTIQIQLERLAALYERLIRIMQNILKENTNHLKNAVRALETISPLATLSRGYSIVSKPDEEIVRSVKDVRAKDILEIKFSDGKVLAEVL